MLGRMGRHAASEPADRIEAFAAGRILVVALGGWNDAGEAATAAVEELRRVVGATRMIDVVDDEDFFDYSIQRPRIGRDEHGVRRFEWPSTVLFGAEAGARERVNLAEDAALRVSGGGGDLLVLTGPEPTLRWRSYADRIMELCVREGVTRLVLLGALLADAPHSRPIQVHASSEDPSVQAEFGVERSEYSGPTGVLSVLGTAGERLGMRVLSLWASVPHYAHHAPSPKAVLALVDRLEEVVDVPIPRQHLVEAAREWVDEVDGAVAEDGEIGEYVRFLERAYDTVEAPEASGEAIAKEFERFLQRDVGPGKPGGPGWAGTAEDGEEPDGPQPPQGG